MKRVFGLLIGLLLAQQVYANTYFVATTGNNGNSGTIGSPWLTVRYGVAHVVAGDTLNIRTGTYVERIQNGDVPDGTAGNVITIQAYNGEVVTLRPTSGTNVVSLNGVDYTTWNSIIMDGGGLSDDGVNCNDILVLVNSTNNIFNGVDSKNSLCNGIQVAQGSNYNQFINVDSFNIGQSFPPGNPLYNLRDDHGMYINQNSHDTIIDGGLYHDTFGFCIHVYNSGLGGLNNTIIKNVEAYNCGYRGGVQNAVTNSAGILVSDGNNSLIYNNLVHESLGPGIQLSSASGIGVYNNSVYNNGHVAGWAGVDISASVTTCLVRNNIIYLNTPTIDNAGSCTTIGNNTTANPLFVNTATGDFHLSAGSPAIGAGATLLVATSDFYGTPRTVPWDTGAIKYTAACTPDHLTYTSQPSSALLNATLGTVSVAIKDSGGTTCTSSTATVTLSKAGGATWGTLASSSSLSKAATSGVATWTDLSVTTTTGSGSIAAASMGLTGATSSSITISMACTPDHLTYTSQPSSAVLGATLGTVSVALKDSGGVTCTDLTSTITLSKNGGATWGTLTSSSSLAKAAVSGVATWMDLSVTTTAGSGSINAAAAVLTGATSSSITIASPPCVPDHLTFTSQPSSALLNASLGTVSVAVKDSGGVTCSVTTTITLSKNAGATWGALTSATSLAKAATAGISTWTDLSVITLIGSGSVDATASGVTVATSSSITVSIPMSSASQRTRLRR